MSAIFPNEKAKTSFYNLQESVSQDGCSDELAVCNKNYLSELYGQKDNFEDDSLKEKLEELNNTRGDDGCEDPFTVIEYDAFGDLEQRIWNLESTHTYTVQVTDIDYEVDDEDGVDPPSLPSELTLHIDGVEHEEDIVQRVSDAISDETGFCHLGFKMETLDTAEE